jgi:hypothetical protein
MILAVEVVQKFVQHPHPVFVRALQVVVVENGGRKYHALFLDEFEGLRALSLDVEKGT